jgi:sortase (surface protein transpeptidase)
VARSSPLVRLPELLRCVVVAPRRPADRNLDQLMSQDEQPGRSARRRYVGGLAVLLVLAGIVVLVVGLRSQNHAPQPSSAAAGTQAPASMRAAAGTATSSAPAPAPRGPLLPKSNPTRLEIPTIGVSSSLLQLALNADQTVQVPPLDKDSRAGWYTGSPTPGQLGPSLLLGHVDSAEYGPGVFFKLGALHQGDTVEVTRADATVAVFRIDRVASFPKDHFPTLEVYGDTSNAQLRLITCGGKFDFSARSYESNIVVFASLVSSHRA